MNLRSFLFASTTLGVLALALGCAGLPMGGSHANVEACKKYVDHFNSLACTKMVPLKAEDYCPAQLDQMPCDMSAHYECLTTNTKCNGEIPDLAGQTSCTNACN